MAKPTPLQLAVLVAYLAIAAFAIPYLAGALYFVANKTLPAELVWDSWYRYWQLVNANVLADPAAAALQRGRLLGAAMVALALVAGGPLLLLCKAWSAARPLHGDARWASDSEIRKAGLL